MVDPPPIFWAEHASEDLQALVRYIARSDPEAAGRIGREIYAKVEILREFPEIGGKLEELQSQGWRKLTFRRWKIIYAYRNNEITIGRVWPAALGDADLDTPLENFS